jgi:hypothetical protein
MKKSTHKWVEFLGMGNGKEAIAMTDFNISRPRGQVEVSGITSDKIIN